MGRPPKSARVNETRSAEKRESGLREMPTASYMGRLYVDQSEIPDGWTYGWVRISTFGEPDDDNWDLKSSNGWEPVSRDAHPKLSRGSLLPGRTNDPYSAVIVRGGLLLCRKPTGEVNADKEKFQVLAQQRFQKVNEWRGGEGVDPLMPRFDHSSVERTNQPSFKKD